MLTPEISNTSKYGNGSYRTGSHKQFSEYMTKINKLLHDTTKFTQILHESADSLGIMIYSTVNIGGKIVASIPGCKRLLKA